MRKWLDITPVLRVHLARPVAGQPIAAFRALSQQLDIAYLPVVSPVRMDAFYLASRSLRDAIHLLQCKCTPLVHMWLQHVPQFLRHWGTLYPFIGHGVEGRHRLMKCEVRSSTCGQWKGDQSVSPTLFAVIACGET
eukprot:TRINITY_DN8089_c0_g1_i1.p2 TRINITY_DN8089_c0_g1~~TRINITY_DN8089_c0_g1_i1.p2  ORF type:complete len:136 (-),score=17.17 TRINITY_DN8089_c0_g1_i1:67-474(-)